MNLPFNACKLFIAGLDNAGLPLIKKETHFTCLRCAVHIYHAGIGKIYIPVVDKWVGISAKEAVKTARAYAMKEKTV